MSARARKVPGIHNIVLTELYVVVARDQKGEPRGFEDSSPHLVACRVCGEHIENT